MARLMASAAREPRVNRPMREQRIIYGAGIGGRRWPAPASRVKERKRPAVELVAMLDLGGIRPMALRPLGAYKPRSPDLLKELNVQIEHLFVEYSVPPCLYEACIPGEAPFHFAHGMYRQWLVTIGQGGSFSKLAKPFMTSIEAHFFLSAPARNRVHENVWWAKLKAAGLPNDAIKELVDRIFTYHFFDDPCGRLAETIRFYSLVDSQMDKTTFSEITDCVAWKLRNEPKFRMRGRTLISMTRLTKEWHVEMQMAKLRSLLEWPGLMVRDWRYETQDKLWTVRELRTNIELLNEGRKQRHCVFAYVPQCEARTTAIFSMRGYLKVASGSAEDGQVVLDQSDEQNRITIEVNDQRTIVQLRGLLN